MSELIVIDLDGCVSNDLRRRVHLPTTHDQEVLPHSAYAAYHVGLEEDQPMNLDLLRLHTHLKPVIITARPETERGATVRWVNAHIAPVFDVDAMVILMRPVGDTRPSSELKTHLLQKAVASHPRGIGAVAVALDDRLDVLQAYRGIGVTNVIQVDHRGWSHAQPAFPKPREPGPGESMADVVEPQDGHRAPIAPTARILGEMAKTYQERNEVYGDNFKQVGDAMAAMFPNGITLRTPDDFNRWHLFELAMVKFTRFANSGLTHLDSIHDAAVYCAMVESLTDDRKVGENA